MPLRICCKLVREMEKSLACIVNKQYTAIGFAQGFSLRVFLFYRSFTEKDNNLSITATTVNLWAVHNLAAALYKFFRRRRKRRARLRNPLKENADRYKKCRNAKKQFFRHSGIISPPRRSDCPRRPAGRNINRSKAGNNYPKYLFKSASNARPCRASSRAIS